MPYYKNTADNNQLFWVDNTDHSIHLPDGCVFISNVDAELMIRDMEEQLAIIKNSKLTARQFRMALTQLNLRDSVETIVSTGNWELKDWYQYTQNFDRTNEQTIDMLTTLNVINQIDQIWSLGITL